MELDQESKAEEAQEKRKLQEREEKKNPKKFTEKGLATACADLHRLL